MWEIVSSGILVLLVGTTTSAAADREGSFTTRHPALTVWLLYPSWCLWLAWSALAYAERGTG